MNLVSAFQSAWNHALGTLKRRWEEARRRTAGRGAEPFPYKTLLDDNAELITVVDPISGRFIYGNKQACAALGCALEELPGLSITDLDEAFPDGAAWTLFAERVMRGEASGFDSRPRRKPGTTFPVEARCSSGTAGGKAYVVTSARYAAKRERAQPGLENPETMLHQSRKMEAIGLLAGGIAHDFNNLLTIILANSTFLQEKLAPGDPRRNDAEEIEQAGRLASSLTHQLLTFSRRQVLNPKVIDLNELVMEVDRMLRRVIGTDIELITLPTHQPQPVKVDPVQLEQVLMNLAVNARDAMPGGGRLVIRLGGVAVSRNFVRRHPEVAPGDYAMITVADNGAGMTEEVSERIFEPFFTTKRKGKGTGLGLATCYGAVRQNDGHILVQSKPGKGTIFRIYLPRCAQAITPLLKSEKPAALPKGDETVLIVEDQPSVRRGAARMLRKQGYAVLEASDGEEALGLLESRPGERIHLLITDIVMPRLCGDQLAERVVSSRSDIKVLFMSGYADRAIDRKGLLRPGRDFLPKPFLPIALAYKVRELLDQPDEKATSN
ncbi:MAG: ATP-binding protein [Elusimicrobiota bacterium]